MTTLIVDTNVISFLMGGKPPADEYRQMISGYVLAASFMTVGELFEGAYRAGWGAKKQAHLRAVLQKYLIVPFSWGLCLEWAAIRTERRHQPIAVDDAWIAATARFLKCGLVTHNPKDFRGISDLQVLTANQTPDG